MKKMLFEQLLSELKLQNNFAIISINLLKEQFIKEKEKEFDFEVNANITYTIWYSIQNYIVSLSNISKIMYGVKGKTPIDKWEKRKKERRFLREKLKLSENSELRNRTMRNLLEHIDENIEQFVMTNPKIIINRFIGPSEGSIQVGDDSLYNENFYNLRGFLTNKGELWLFNQKFNIESTFEEVIQLRDSIINLEKKLEAGELNDIFD
ncbi:hypothetical protein AB6878_12805 [Carnobacterium maltaromaticum]|uniref:hypothetical protein n=1 Tax=Carnobacterium maltaromaticum TaxID=2751 RepID=UPI0039BE11E7